MVKNSLVVAETFYSIQGEGQTMGVPAVFLRLGGCNLLCKGSWICDTIEVWQKGKSTIFMQVLSEEYITKLKEGAHLVITGGEPLLQQTAIIEYIKWLWKQKVNPIIEIETNGTIEPHYSLLQNLVSYWNVSPKLANSGMSYDSRVNEIALRKLQSAVGRTIFKFVINDREDFLEIDSDYGFLDHDKLVLMPAGSTIAQLNRTREMVIELCKVMTTRYCDRLHVVAWNQATGV